MAAAVAAPWRAPGLAMAPGGHLDSGIATITTIATTITNMTTIATIVIIATSGIDIIVTIATSTQALPIAIIVTISTITTIIPTMTIIMVTGQVWLGWPARARQAQFPRQLGENL